MIARIAVPGALCLVLAGIVAAELATDAAIEDLDLPAARAAAVVLPEPAQYAAAETPVADILARPLFTPNRQPSARSGDKPVAASAFHRRLVGVAIGPVTREALFAGEGKDKPTVVAEGGAIEGWTVETVADGVVTIRAGNASQAVEIARGKPGTTKREPPRVDAVSTALMPTRRDR